MCELEDEFSGPVIDALSLRRGEVLLSPLFFVFCCVASMAMHHRLCLHVARYDTCSAMCASEFTSRTAQLPQLLHMSHQTLALGSTFE